MIIPIKFENPEEPTEQLIEQLAEAEDMDPNDIKSDLVTFYEISQEDSDAAEYLKEVAEKLNITLEKLVEYIKTLI